MAFEAMRRRVKSRARSIASRVRQTYVDTFLSFGSAELAAALRRAGVAEGDQLMLHSAFDRRHGFRGSVTNLIDCLTTTVGKQGGVYMVSLPYASSTAEYLRRDPVFDVRRTPSRMGLISEFFRRQPGVIRSEHPTHPILGRGLQAPRVLEGHARCAYGCGPGSPFERLLQRAGKVAFLNVPMDTMTYFHYLEHLIAPSLPFPLYEQEPMTARMRDESGAEQRLETWVFSAEAIRRRRPAILQAWMQAAAIVGTAEVGATSIRVIPMKEVTELVLGKAARGEFFFDMAE
jgi:aminoglycoside 3-N-acetyltransferase